MKRFTWALIGLLASSATPAWAQLGVYQRPFTPRPTFSPYLNLNRAGNPAVNYYGLVRPQQQFSRDVQTLQAQVEGLTPSGAALPQTPDGSLVIPTTGHPVTFFNWSHYYGTPGFRAGGVAPGFGGPSATGFGAGAGPTIAIGATGTIRR
jgi:hypothetical protein